MFNTLLESRAARIRRTGSSVASVILHSAIISAGVVATAREAATFVQPEILVPVIWTQPRNVLPPKPYTGPKSASASNDALTPLTPLPTITVPVAIPVGIPDIDLSAVPVTYNPGATRIATAGILCTRDCDPAPVIDHNGRVLLSGNDIGMRLAEQPVPPRYPESLRRAGIEGDVVVKFVVDTTGRVDLRSVEIVSSTHDAFTLAVRESLGRLRFQPSVVGERKMNSLAVMPFRFTLR